MSRLGSDDNPAYTPTPMEILTFSLSQSVDTIMVKTEQQDLPPGINPSRNPLWSADNDTIFPAANINLFANFYLWHTYWALPTQLERSAKKMSSTFEEIKALYDLGMRDDNLPRALRHCDQFPLSELPPEVATLFQITLSMAEVRPQVELYRQVHSPIPGEEVLPSRLAPTPEYDRL